MDQQHGGTVGLDTLKRGFPGYAFDVAVSRGGFAYVARRRRPGNGPHTLVSADLAEIRAELTPAAQGGLPRRTPGVNFRPAR
jgi:hypothetical protein